MANFILLLLTSPGLRAYSSGRVEDQRTGPGVGAMGGVVSSYLDEGKREIITVVEVTPPTKGLMGLYGSPGRSTSPSSWKQASPALWVVSLWVVSLLLGGVPAVGWCPCGWCPCCWVVSLLLGGVPAVGWCPCCTTSPTLSDVTSSEVHVDFNLHEAMKERSRPRPLICYHELEGLRGP
ncbi:hypothetical protein EYF80_063903 [Liparis tanakae]|uniref:Uncharacterized protein n=1 Tax=Liparis tanakae TaxID=230148 RepID=A0A4Z2EBL5_9TELE|nr:hypothetical protein EYF80_063903 [Liparis tanakae]